jgi:adenine-specific DNA-methyltransferase
MTVEPSKPMSRTKIRKRATAPTQLAVLPSLEITDNYSPNTPVTLYHGDRLDLLRGIGNDEAKLVVTSPPYNIGKPYEKRKALDTYLGEQEETIRECVRILDPRGSICWQVGNHIDKGEVFPLDTLLYPIFKQYGMHLRNRIIWHFEHGLHSSRRFSGRYETIIWFTKSDDYVFNLDDVRVPQKYPGKKAYKGPKAGQYSGNPLGKNPADMWIIPNVKHNHPEKTDHPCQFPVELIQRLLLALTNEGDLVVDPYIGVGTTAVAAVIHGRRAAGADLLKKYIDIARDRVSLAWQGRLPIRPMDRSVYQPSPDSSLVRNPWNDQRNTQLEIVPPIQRR